MTTQHFEPGPVEFTQALDEKVTATRDLVARLLASAEENPRERLVVAIGGGQTDATGFLKAVVYECPAGFVFYIHRINLEAMNTAAGVSYTPAAPYATGWVGFYRGEPGFGGLTNFVPTVVGGAVFPQVLVDGSKQAAAIRGERVVMQVTGGPASVAVHCVLTGRLVQL
jgi:hypothetical protein